MSGGHRAESQDQERRRTAKGNEEFGNRPRDGVDGRSDACEVPGREAFKGGSQERQGRRGVGEGDN